MLFTKQRFKSTIHKMFATNQQNEDRYGNEIKRRRTDTTGNYLKVWRVCEFKYGLKQDAQDKIGFNEEDFVSHEEVRQEEVHQEEVQHEEEVQEVVAQFAALAISEVQEVQEIQAVQEPPLHVLGRRVVIYTTDNETVRGTIESLFDLNGERAIQIQTSAGKNQIFKSSQIVGLEVLLNPNEEQLSPIAPIAPIASSPEVVRPEVVQIEDDDEVIQIEDDNSDASTQAPEQDQDDFPEVEFIQPQQPRRQPQPQPQEEQDCCAICLDMTDAARNFVSLDCGHQFHFACIMGNMANGGATRNQCPMCRGTVVQQYDIHNEDNEEEIIARLARGNQHMQDELDQTRQHREDLTEEYVRVMSMNMQISMRHQDEREARNALEHRAELCFLNERIARVVLSAANNDVRQNYEDRGVRMHIERQIRDLCMSFGMMAYDAQYDQANQDQANQEEEYMEVD